jgi:hypothetical protein
MGLDQYAHATNTDGETVEEISYWRKHNRLQGWMENLWREKGRPNAHPDVPEDGMDFNCVPLPLTREDIDALEVIVNGKDLPETVGFFFGGDSYEDYEGEWGDKKADLEFIQKARAHLKEGNEVSYSCWW